jgi:hypothetical protein
MRGTGPENGRTGTAVGDGIRALDGNAGGVGGHDTDQDTGATGTWTGDAGLSADADTDGLPVNEEVRVDPRASWPVPDEEAGVEAFLDGFAGILADAAVTGRRLTRDEIESRRALGARAAQAGHGWRTLVRAHLAAGRTGRPAGADPDSVLAVVEQTVDAFADGYERAQRHVVRREEAARREFIDDLLHGRGDPGQLASRCERFGLRLSRTHAVAVAGGPELSTAVLGARLLAWPGRPL